MTETEAAEIDHMRSEAVQVVGDRLEVTSATGQQFTFPLDELRATRKPQRLNGPSRSLTVNPSLAALETARNAAEAYAVEQLLL